MSMKRFLLFFCASIGAAVSLSAQEPILKEKVKGNEAVVCEIRNLEPQGSYMPSFNMDRSDLPVQNVILMIGDGMGLGAVASAMYANGGELTMTNLQTIGMVRTQSADSFTTDSAASGTAYATGYKTHNGGIGVNAENNVIQNIPEILSEKGIISGVISTDDLHGATPAAFYAHQKSRKMTDEIWNDVADSKLTFFAAASMDFFEKQPEDTRNAINGNFTIVNSLDDSKALKKSKRLGYLPPKSETDFIVEGRGDFLPETTSFALDYLSRRSKNGFFLMVEGARIDKAAHKNKYESSIKETLDFDKAVEVAVRFAETHGNTLVIISADHETGALSLKSGEPEKGNIKGIYSSMGHTPMMVPLFAYGPQSLKFAGIQENSDVAKKIIEVLADKTSR